MNERIAVQAFERTADLKGSLLASAEEARRLHHEIRAQALAAVQGTVMHGLDQPFGADDFRRTRLCVQKDIEPRLDERGVGGQAFFKGIGALGHHGYLARYPWSGNGKLSLGKRRKRAPRLVICQEGGYDGPSSIMDPTSLTMEVEALEQDEKFAPETERRRRPRIIRALLIALLIFLATPYLLILLYRLDFVRPVSTLMLADLATLQGYDRRWVDFEDISPNVVRAVMMSEDGQFCNHGGVDWTQLQSVIDDAMAGAATRGASTIPMQTAKNLFLWNGRSFIRKGLELPLAMAADAVWPKERMMEIYLNVAEWGPGIYGIEAAARYHFNTSAAKLSRQQAALLAVSLPNPIDRVASKPGPGLKRLANVVDRRARQSGAYVTCLYG